MCNINYSVLYPIYFAIFIGGITISVIFISVMKEEFFGKSFKEVVTRIKYNYFNNFTRWRMKFWERDYFEKITQIIIVNFNIALSLFLYLDLYSIYFTVFISGIVVSVIITRWLVKFLDRNYFETIMQIIIVNFSISLSFFLFHACGSAGKSLFNSNYDLVKVNNLRHIETIIIAVLILHLVYVYYRLGQFLFSVYSKIISVNYNESNLKFGPEWKNVLLSSIEQASDEKYFNTIDKILSDSIFDNEDLEYLLNQNFQMKTSNTFSFENVDNRKTFILLKHGIEKGIKLDCNEDSRIKWKSQVLYSYYDGTSILKQPEKYFLNQNFEVLENLMYGLISSSSVLDQEDRFYKVKIRDKLLNLKSQLFSAETSIFLDVTKADKQILMLKHMLLSSEIMKFKDIIIKYLNDKNMSIEAKIYFEGFLGYLKDEKLENLYKKKNLRVALYEVDDKSDQEIGQLYALSQKGEDDAVSYVMEQNGQTEASWFGYVNPIFQELENHKNEERLKCLGNFDSPLTEELLIDVEKNYSSYAEEKKGKIVTILSRRQKEISDIISEINTPILYSKLQMYLGNEPEIILASKQIKNMFGSEYLSSLEEWDKNYSDVLNQSTIVNRYRTEPLFDMYIDLLIQDQEEEFFKYFDKYKENQYFQKRLGKNILRLYLQHDINLLENEKIKAISWYEILCNESLRMVNNLYDGDVKKKASAKMFEQASFPLTSRNMNLTLQRIDSNDILVKEFDITKITIELLVMYLEFSKLQLRERLIRDLVLKIPVQKLIAELVNKSNVVDEEVKITLILERALETKEEIVYLNDTIDYLYELSKKYEHLEELIENVMRNSKYYDVFMMLED